MKREITNEMIKKLVDLYESNKEILYELNETIDENGILDNGISDIDDTFEMGYNNALQYVFQILDIKDYEHSNKKEINRVAFEIEHFNGSTYMGFMLSIKEDGSVELIENTNCNLADIEEDYIFDTNNELYRIQADEPISETDYEDSINWYNELKIEK